MLQDNKHAGTISKILPLVKHSIMVLKLSLYFLFNYLERNKFRILVNTWFHQTALVTSRTKAIYNFWRFKEPGIFCVFTNVVCRCSSCDEPILHIYIRSRIGCVKHQLFKKLALILKRPEDVNSCRQKWERGERVVTAAQTFPIKLNLRSSYMGVYN